MIEKNGEVLVITTFAQQEAATEFARKVVEKRLAACATCLPGGLSFFRWQSESISEEAEVLLLIKTHREKLKLLESYFEMEHPYEVPEFIVVEIAAMSAAYGKWLHEELKLAAREDA